jgi:hypothetical protein
MPENFDEIPIDELLIFDGDELIFDGSDPATYITIRPGASADEILQALTQDSRADDVAATDGDRPDNGDASNRGPSSPGPGTLRASGRCDGVSCSPGGRDLGGCGCGERPKGR